MPSSKSIPSKSYPTIAVVGKQFGTGIAGALSELAAFLRSTGREVVFEAETARAMAFKDVPALAPAEIGQQADAAIVVGGDGTMLGIARLLAPYSVPLIGINQGRLGFMTDISLDQMIPVLTEMLNGKIESEQRGLLEGAVIRNGEVIVQTCAFNDVVVSRGTGSGMVELRVEVGGQFMYNQRSDGLIVATPTGSTAYALSAGGPILHPTLNGIVMVPIAPHALSNRPIVVPDTSEIVIEVIGGRKSNVNFDMQSVAKLVHHDRIMIRRSPHTITFLHPQGWSYYDTLRRKLHWNEYPSAQGQLT
jgi:NAD+ kinase